MKEKNEGLWIEKYLIILFASLFTLLLAVNLLKIYQFSQRQVMGVKGSGYQSQMPISQKGSLILQLEGDLLYPKIEILINGERIGYFGNTNLLLIEVEDKDVVALNSSMYEEPIYINIVNATDNIHLAIENKRIKAEKLTTIALIKIS
ncbi:hypothetical protein [Alkaliphilus serpentinus]|uniref:Uncharacterized protein n=1 Tax=Alkaliphilus serpentinus TaxID=1482731 RepID=A0A833M5U4_9FIRM|nr:hypothetical protein [Alkaliphilus serpentinus]KAB3524950.1 hypothetical protein F8153_15450 [Alkaliphilus serpentinus]